jgi:hypothetical protein
MLELTTRSEVSDASVGLSNSHWGGRGSEQVINHDGAGINIVVGSSRAVDDHGTSDTVTVLSEHVRVVPASSILAGLEGVGTSLTGSDSALSDTWNTVLIVGTLMDHTVPMDGSSVVLHLVRDGDLDGITPIAFQKRTWNLPVDGKSKAWDTVVVLGRVCDDPVSRAGLASARAFLVVVGIDAILAAPLASVGSRVAASLGKRRERCSHVRGVGSRSWASSVDPAATAGAGRACVARVVMASPVTPASIGWCS